MPIGPKNKLEILPEIQGGVLKAAREKLRLEIPDLATKACLSKKHITELEQGGISSFYSKSHKITVAKKVAKILQLDESLILVHPDGDVAQQESLPFDAVIDDADQPKPVEAKVTKEATVIAPEAKPALEEQKQATAHSTPKSANKSEANQPNQTSKVTLENLQSGGQMDSSKPKTKRSRSALLSVLLLILVAGGLYSSKDDIIALFNPPAEEPQALVAEGAASQDTKEEGSNPANTVAPAAPAPAPANPSAPSSAAPVAASVAAVVPFPSDVGCPKPDANVADQSVTEPGKPGNFVYVHVKSRQIVCVVDATGKSMMQSIEAGSGHTYVGKAPFTVLTNGLSQTSVYFQGRLARPINEQARTMRLVDVPFN